MLVIVLAAALYIMLSRENSKREKLVLQGKEAERVAFEDLTDKENPFFRYAY